jgi:hypothetical protein
MLTKSWTDSRAWRLMATLTISILGVTSIIGSGSGARSLRATAIWIRSTTTVKRARMDMHLMQSNGAPFWVSISTSKRSL